MKLLNESNEKINLIKQRFFKIAGNRYNLIKNKNKNNNNIQKGTFLNYQKNNKFY
jgi:hypothetical protein